MVSTKLGQVQTRKRRAPLNKTLALKMRAIAICIFTLLSTLADAADEGRPTGQNCNLRVPPKNAGEEFNHRITLKIYPRARDISKTYTGCQTLWMPDEKQWRTIAVTAIENGYAVRIWSPDQTDSARLSCRYKEGRIVRGDSQQCPAPEYLIIKSLAAGCVERIANAAGKLPSGCGYE